MKPICFNKGISSLTLSVALPPFAAYPIVALSPKAEYPDRCVLPPKACCTIAHEPQ